MAKKSEPAPAEAIDPDAYYRVTVSAAVAFERALLGPQALNELSGGTLQRLLASEHAPLVTGYEKA